MFNRVFSLVLFCLVCCLLTLGMPTPSQKFGLGKSKPKPDQKNETAEGEIAKGIAFYNQGLLSPAVAQFTKAVELSKEKSAEAYFWRGLTLIDMHDTNDAYDALAFESLNHAVTLRKDYVEANYLLWLTIAQSGAYDSSRARAALALVTTPPLTLPRRIHLKIGETLSNGGFLDRATAEFRVVSELKTPESAPDSYVTQQLARNLEGFRGDIAQHNGNFATGHYKLARGLFLNKDVDGAIGEALLAVKQRDNYSDAYLFLSSLYFIKQDYVKAIGTLQQFLTQFPDDIHYPLFRCRINVILQAAKLPATPVVANPDTPAKPTVPGTVLLTEDAKEHKISGVVTVEATFTGQGTIENPVVLKGLGYGLDERAVQVMMGLHFEPAVKDGKPVAVRQKLDLTFASN